MSHDNPRAVIGLGSATIGGDFAKEHRARVALASEELQRKRTREAAVQTDESLTPQERIRAWERIHELRLPTDPTHPLVRFIARVTGLGVPEVHEEQRRRISSGERPTPTSASLSWNTRPIR
jgi:hypothetical protein